MSNKTKFSLTYCLLFLTIVAKAQLTLPFNYNGVALNTSGQPISSTTVGIEISILKTSPAGATQYSEHHFAATDAFGFFNLQIGNGAAQTGSFINIDWSNDNYYLKVGLDATGGTNFVTIGTTQFLSVPYAIYANSAGTAKGGGGNFTHYIGEVFGGGVIFHLWKDAQGVEHGLIVDKTDISTGGVEWSPSTSTYVTGAQSSWDGLANTNASSSLPAASLCLNSGNGGQFDWYLPAIDELRLLWDNIYVVNKTLSSISNATVLPVGNPCWSSTEYLGGINGLPTPEYAWVFDFSSGYSGPYAVLKNYEFNYIRAIRAF